MLAPEEAKRGPNVILLSLDSLGARYLSANGYAAQTSPRLDALIADSFSFDRAYAQYPATLVSHGSLFTARYPRHHGRYLATSAPLVTLVQEIAHAGYWTAAFTENAWVSSAFGFARDFDRYADGVERGAVAVLGDAPGTFAHAGDWLAEHGKSERFFLFVHTYEVHSPYLPRARESRALADALTPGDTRSFEPRAMNLALIAHNQEREAMSDRDLRRYEALHAGEIRDLDDSLGEFLDRLGQLGLLDDVLLVVTSDHGEQFGQHGRVEHGESLHERVLHVPLLFRWPGHIAPGRSRLLAQSIDVMPTVLDLLGLALPGGIDGRSLAPVLRGEVAALEERPAFAELQSDSSTCRDWVGPGPCRLGRYAVRGERYKYLSSELPRYERLYDVEADPDERTDLAAAHPDELARHRALLVDYLESAPADRPQTASEIEDATLERLRALGYLD